MQTESSTSAEYTHCMHCDVHVCRLTCKHPACYSALQAANYLNIKSLLDLTCLTVANMIKGVLNMQHCSICQCAMSTGIRLLTLVRTIPMN
jgi:Skp1 family, dimerisation domain